MKVKKLKEILDKLPDNVEIKMFHPAAIDFVDFEIVETQLMRMKRTSLLETLNLRQQRDGKPLYKLEDIGFDEWSLIDDYSGVDFDENYIKQYETKKILMICNKTKGATTFDRLGTMSY
jgi:hypothetical protein